MSQEIRINYQEVYTKTAELRQRIQTKLQEMENTYRQVNTGLNQMDSYTNAVLIETMEQNRLKAQLTAETLNKLLSFIEASAQQVERDEAIIARTFATSTNATRINTNVTRK